GPDIEGAGGEVEIRQPGHGEAGSGKAGQIDEAACEIPVHGRPPMRVVRNAVRRDSSVGAAGTAGTGMGSAAVGTGVASGRSSASASASVSRRTVREKSTRPLRSTAQTGMVPVG